MKHGENNSVVWSSSTSRSHIVDVGPIRQRDLSVLFAKIFLLVNFPTKMHFPRMQMYAFHWWAQWPIYRGICRWRSETLVEHIRIDISPNCIVEKLQNMLVVNLILGRSRSNLAKTFSVCSHLIINYLICFATCCVCKMQSSEGISLRSIADYLPNHLSCDEHQSTLVSFQGRSHSLALFAPAIVSI